MKKPQIIFRKHTISPRQVQQNQNFDQLFHQYRRKSKQKMTINAIVLIAEVIVVILLTCYIIYRYNSRSTEPILPDNKQVVTDTVSQKPAPVEKKKEIKTKKSVETTTTHYDTVRTYHTSQLDQMPQFPGGQGALDEFIDKKLNAEAIAGRDYRVLQVRVQFVITQKGEVKDIKVTNPDTYREVSQRVIKMCKQMPRWTPAMQAGQPVEVTYTLIVPYQFQGI